MERRRQARYELDIPILVSSCEDELASSFMAACRDISSTGVFIRTAASRLGDRQRVHLEMTLSIGKIKELFGSSSMVKLAVNGSVVRSIKEGVVVEFEEAYSISPL